MLRQDGGAGKVQLLSTGVYDSQGGASFGVGDDGACPGKPARDRRESSEGERRRKVVSRRASSRTGAEDALHPYDDSGDSAGRGTHPLLPVAALLDHADRAPGSVADRRPNVVPYVTGGPQPRAGR